MIGSGMVARSIPYTPGLGAKQFAWMTHAAIMGAVIAPLAFVGGPIILRAAWYTAGIVGGLSTVAVCAPSEKFLTMGAPLAMGLGVVFAASLGSMFLPPTTALGAGLYSISLYGGLLLFSGFLLYDTQKIVKRAENTPLSGGYAYDPINNSINIFMDTLNIFIRIVSILAGGGNRRK
jgi:growth hormone-inducible transmembrane protein